MHFKSNNIPFVTADTHYFHNNVIKYDNRPFSSEKEMRNTLIDNYNATVPPNGTCFWIGDVAMVGASQWEKITALLKKLNGTKYLILGNHDEIKPFRYIDCGFASVHTSLIVTIDLDESIVPRRKLTQNFVLAHDPCVWSQVPENHILLCGHVHKLFKILPDKNTINVGVDHWDYNPMSFKELYMELINAKEGTQNKPNFQTFPTTTEQQHKQITERGFII